MNCISVVSGVSNKKVNFSIFGFILA